VIAPGTAQERRSIPLTYSKYSIGLATVVLLVVLRLALGCHFFYEGVWKHTHPKEFAAETEGFLTAARGPLAGMFYAMVPDIDGRERLAGGLHKGVETMIPEGGNAKRAKADRVQNEARTRRWEAIRDRFVAAYDDLSEPAEKVFQEQLAAAEMYLADNWEDIQAHFAALDRFEEARKSSPRTAFQAKRDWDEMRKLRSEAKKWLSALDEREDAYKAALAALPSEEQVRPRDPLAPSSWNPFAWTRMEQIRFAITWGLTAIGLCLMLGLATRPAALGGGLFMLFVVMSQPSFPGVVPPDPPQLGHALLVNKDFVEMVALFLLASTAAGRWGGLDWFVHHFITEPFLSKSVGRSGKEK
jgi:uncharacterized membrane protein YphA (DoxX/SURF4 family)